MPNDRRTMMLGTVAAALSPPVFGAGSTSGWYDRAIVIDALGNFLRIYRDAWRA